MGFKVFLLTVCFLPMANGDIPSGFSNVVQEVEKVNSMREGLVHSVNKKSVDLQTFKQVCGPVGIMVKELSKKNAWELRQVSPRFRNPLNKSNKIEDQAMRRFSNDKELTSFFTFDKTSYFYFRRINVKQNCLICHGNKSDRPEFVKKKYPLDKAFGFKVGELRGIYSARIKK